VVAGLEVVEEIRWPPWEGWLAPQNGHH